MSAVEQHSQQRPQGCAQQLFAGRVPWEQHRQTAQKTQAIPNQKEEFQSKEGEVQQHSKVIAASEDGVPWEQHEQTTQTKQVIPNQKEEFQSKEGKVHQHSKVTDASEDGGRHPQLQRKQQHRVPSVTARPGLAEVAEAAATNAEPAPIALVGASVRREPIERQDRWSKSGSAASERSSLRKTRLCKFFSMGSCPNGIGCTFAHGEQELRQKPDLFRTEICHAFAKDGCCRFGDACHFAHSTGELRSGSVETPGSSLPEPATGSLTMDFPLALQQGAAWSRSTMPATAAALELEMLKQAAGDLHSTIGKLEGFLHSAGCGSGAQTPEIGGSSIGSRVTTAEGDFDVWSSQDQLTWSSMKTSSERLQAAMIPACTLTSWDHYGAVLGTSSQEACIGFSF